MGNITAIVVVVTMLVIGTMGILMPTTQVKADPQNLIFNEHTHSTCAIGVPNGCSTNSGQVTNGPTGHQNCNYNEQRSTDVNKCNP